MVVRNQKDDEPREAEDLEPGEAGQDASLELQTPEDELETLRRERDEFKERWQRAAADYQNLKRRQLSDIEAAVRRSQTPLLEDALLVLDYLDMAVAMPVSEPEAKNLMVGVEMTRQQFMSVLERQDIQAIETTGTFDPARHQAVGTVETDECEPGTIIDTMRSGWTYRGQVLRPAQVKVATSSVEETSELTDETAPDPSPEA